MCLLRHLFIHCFSDVSLYFRAFPPQECSVTSSSAPCTMSDDDDNAALSALQSAQSIKRLRQISSLRAGGISDKVNLPQLIVAGDQSAGKSSVLEGITGIPFPREGTHSIRHNGRESADLVTCLPQRVFAPSSLPRSFSSTRKVQQRSPPRSYHTRCGKARSGLDFKPTHPVLLPSRSYQPSSPRQVP